MIYATTNTAGQDTVCCFTVITDKPIRGSIGCVGSAHSWTTTKIMKKVYLKSCFDHSKWYHCDATNGTRCCSKNNWLYSCGLGFNIQKNFQTMNWAEVQSNAGYASGERLIQKVWPSVYLIIYEPKSNEAVTNQSLQVSCLSRGPRLFHHEQYVQQQRAFHYFCLLETEASSWANPKAGKLRLSTCRRLNPQ